MRPLTMSATTAAKFASRSVKAIERFAALRCSAARPSGSSSARSCKTGAGKVWKEGLQWLLDAVENLFQEVMCRRLLTLDQGRFRAVGPIPQCIEIRPNVAHALGGVGIDGWIQAKYVASGDARTDARGIRIEQPNISGGVCAIMHGQMSTFGGGSNGLARCGMV